MSTDRQSEQILSFRNAFNESIIVLEVSEGAKCIVTPFLDWQGSPTRIYVTRDGLITDGGATSNLLKALNEIEQFESWPFQQDFLARYNIEFDGESMMLRKAEGNAAYLKYAQGISRLPSYFEPKPSGEGEDRYPDKVKVRIEEIIEESYPRQTKEETRKWATSLTHTKRIPLKNGYIATSDLSPVREDRMVEIISHQASSLSDRKAHVASKLLDPTLWRRDNPHGEVFAVLENLDSYQSSRKLLTNEAKVIETKRESGIRDLIEILVS